MKNNHLFVAFFVALIFSTAVGAEQHSHQTQINWSEGDTFSYLITKSKEQVNPGGSKSGSSVQSAVSINVLTKKDDLYEIEWVIGESKLLAGPDIENPLAAALINLMEGAKALLVIDHDGAIKDLKNWQELKQLANESADQTFALMVDEGVMPEDAANRFKEMTTAIYQNKESVMDIALPDVTMFFTAYGFQGLSDLKQDFEAQVPNPLAGESFPAIGTVELEKFDEDKKQLHVLWRQESDPKEINRIMYETVLNMSKQLGKPTPAIEQLPRMWLLNEHRAVISSETGKLITAEHITDSGVTGTRVKEQAIFALQ